MVTLFAGLVELLERWSGVARILRYSTAHFRDLTPEPLDQVSRLAVIVLIVCLERQDHMARFGEGVFPGYTVPRFLGKKALLEDASFQHTILVHSSFKESCNCPLSQDVRAEFLLPGFEAVVPHGQILLEYAINIAFALVDRRAPILAGISKIDQDRRGGVVEYLPLELGGKVAERLHICDSF